MSEAKKIVCLGGGNAMPQAVLAGLKKHPVKLSVISAMLDSGGSAGKERRDYHTKVSFGDMRRAALALSEVTEENKNRFAYRYKDCPLAGHVMANLYSTATVFATNNLEGAVKELTEDLQEDLKISPQHQLLPVTLENSTLCVVLENGESICGESNIDVPEHDGKLKIKKAFLEPKAKACPGALKAIKEADFVIIGPGDLYSSLAQILLVEGISQAIEKSRAKKIYLCNLMTKNGETNNFTVLDFTTEIEKYLGGLLNFVIYNTKKPSPKKLKAFKKKNPELLDLVKFDKKLVSGKKYLGLDLLVSSDSIVHDTDKLTEVILKLCKR